MKLFPLLQFNMAQIWQSDRVMQATVSLPISFIAISLASVSAGRFHFS
jgi:hypothetical protein